MSIALTHLLRHAGPNRQNRGTGGGVLQMDSGGWVIVESLIPVLAQMPRMSQVRADTDTDMTAMLAFVAIFGDKSRLELASLRSRADNSVVKYAYLIRSTIGHSIPFLDISSCLA